MLEGLSPDQPIATNERGAMQSATPYRFDLLDAKSMFKLAEVLAIGAKRYAPDNWRGISASDHYNHLMQHLFAWKAGDTQDDHLGHALCRAMMLCAVVESEKHFAGFGVGDVVVIKEHHPNNHLRGEVGVVEGFRRDRLRPIRVKVELGEQAYYTMCEPDELRPTP
jgi:hypothetical protein